MFSNNARVTQHVCVRIEGALACVFVCVRVHAIECNAKLAVAVRELRDDLI